MLEDIQTKIENIPTSYLVVGGVIVLGIFWLLSKSSTGTPEYVASQTSALSDALSRLQEALNNLVGNQTSSGQTQVPGGSGGSGLDPNPTTSPTTSTTTSPTTSTTTTTSPIISSPTTRSTESTKTSISPTKSTKSTRISTPTRTYGQTRITLSELASEGIISTQQAQLLLSRTAPTLPESSPVIRSYGQTRVNLSELASEGVISSQQAMLSLSKISSKPIIKTPTTQLTPIQRIAAAELANEMSVQHAIMQASRPNPVITTVNTPTIVPKPVTSTGDVPIQPIPINRIVAAEKAQTMSVQHAISKTISETTSKVLTQTNPQTSRLAAETASIGLITAQQAQKISTSTSKSSTSKPKTTTTKPTSTKTILRKSTPAKKTSTPAKKTTKPSTTQQKAGTSPTAKKML